MPGHRKPALTAKSVGGLKYFRRLQPLFARLHDLGTDNDHAGNRQLHFGHYASLILLYFFNPCLTSLRSIQQASDLGKVHKKLGVPRTSLGSRSAAARIFDPEPLHAIVAELAAAALPLESGREAEVLRGLTAVDGSLLPALPKMAWALWVDDTHRSAKLHLHFDVFKGVPCRATVTHGSGNERTQLKNTLQAVCTISKTGQITGTGVLYGQNPVSGATFKYPFTITKGVTASGKLVLTGTIAGTNFPATLTTTVPNGPLTFSYVVNGSTYSMTGTGTVMVK